MFGCHALLLLAAGLDFRYKYEVEWYQGRACDIATASRKLLGPFWKSVCVPARLIAANFEDRCMFEDIAQFTSTPDATIQKMELATWLKDNGCASILR